MNSEIHSSDLRRAVLRARGRLKQLEETHERLLDELTSDIRGAGREYAAAVQEYTVAAMAWLSWLERYGQRSERPVGEQELGETADVADRNL